MRPFLAALGFLTLLPVPHRWADPGKHLPSAILFFPAVGFVIGLLAAVFSSLLSLVLPPLPASVLVVILLIAISGGMHTDGLADTADGFFSARSRDRMLEIMRDSRIGVMGVVAVVSVFFLKIALLLSIPPRHAAGIVFLMPLAGRTAIVIQMAFQPYARSSQGGLASIFGEKGRIGAVLIGTFLLLASGWFILQWRGIVAGLAVLGFAVLFSAYCRRMIGGYTGDTLGAVCDLAEIIPALTAVVYPYFPDPTG